MAFSSPLFIYWFLPIFLALYYGVPARARNGTLLVASILFYAAGAGTTIIALLASVWLNHYLARRLFDPDHPHRHLLLAAGIFLNLAALVYYKYFTFLWVSVAEAMRAFTHWSIGPAPGVSLPIGISFFTFQALSYLIDVHAGRTRPALSYGEFATYHTLFPQLVAGPIVRYSEIRNTLLQRRTELPRLTEGVYRFCLGFAKKIILADNLGSVTDQIMRLPADELTGGHAWVGILCYTLQIYYDFSGYSDMAIGLGKLLGFDFPENFDQP